MEKKREPGNPIYYKSAEEIDKPLSELMDQLRTDIAVVRGKLSDIKRSYGWDDRLNDLEGGLTCMIVAMASVEDEWKRMERKEKI